MTFRPTLVLLLAMGALTGCNMITGADGITLRDDDDDGSTDPAGPGSGGSTAGQGGAASTGGSGGSGAEAPQPDMVGADGVTLERVAVYQGVERTLMDGGSETASSTPVVAGREALFRVFYAAQGTVAATARLTIDGQVLEHPVELSGTSTTGSLGSTINFDVPASMMTVGASWRVDVLQPSEQASGTNDAAVYPVDPAQNVSLQTEQSGKLIVKLVPIQYEGDGSGRLPDTSAGQLDLYEDLFYSLYPVSDVELSVRQAALPYSGTVAPGGSGWSDLLNAVADVRQQDGAPFDTYYYGLIEPDSSLGAFCSGGCVSGLGFLGAAGSDYSHAAVGLGFSGPSAVETAVHELGHNHGREHAPCGNASSPDPGYPYAGGAIGAWGYDLLTDQLFAPDGHADMMGYCNPTWISDYNFEALFERVTFNHNADIQIPDSQKNLTYQRARVDAQGELTWMSPIELERPPMGAPKSATITTSSGPETTTASFIPYDHLDGGIVFVPPTSDPVLEQTKELSVTIEGQLLTTQ